MKKFLSFFLAILMVLSLAVNIVVSAGAEEAEEGSFTVIYDLGGGYPTIEALGDAFLADFNKYGEVSAKKETFQGDSSVPVKTALANAEMLEKWNWLWVYMLDHLKATNPDADSPYLIDTYPVLEKMIAGKTTAILDSANARTSIRSYIHGFLNSMKGCGDINTDFSKFSPDFSSEEEQAKLVMQQYIGQNSVGTYSTIEQVGDAFLADFNQYGGVNAAKETFQDDSSGPVKTALANAEMLEKWNWLWVYMLNHLMAANPDVTNPYLIDTYPVLKKMIAGDTTAILDSANARTSIRSYIHGLLNSMKGCGDINTDFSQFSPDFSSEQVRENFMNYDIAVTLNSGAALMKPVSSGDVFAGWMNADGEIVTEATADGKLTAVWKTEEELDDGSIKIPLNGPWDPCLPEVLEGVEAQTRTYYNNPGPHDPGGFTFRYNDGGNQVAAVDISGMTYIEFDVFVSSVAIIADVEFSFELTSGGTCDQEESAKKFAGRDTGWVDGWNHVKWNLNEFNVKNGEFDPTRLNYIRWYNDTPLNATDWLQVGIANVKFSPKSAAELDAEEATKTEHSIPLWGCNSGWDVAGEEWTIDNEDKAAGSGCISINLKDPADVMAPEKHFATPIDGSNMDTLEFDIYLSDIAIVEYFSDTDGALELTSSGKSDHAEVAYNLRNLTKHVLADAQVGWNHVSIKIESMETNDGNEGPFNIAAVNFIRFYWVGPKACDQDWILKLDNFRLTDAAAQKEAEKEAEAQRVLEKHAELLAEIDALESIAGITVTAENYATVKAQCDAVKAKYDAVPEDEKAVLSNKGYGRKITDAFKPIEKYEENLAKADALKDIIAELKALEAYKDASAFTSENYDAVKKQIEDVRMAYNSLAKSDKKYLQDNGHLAHLEAAEAAMPETKPEPPKSDDDVECTEHVDANADGKCDNCGADVEVSGGDNGCKSALTMGALATLILSGAWVTIAARKKQD